MSFLKGYGWYLAKILSIERAQNSAVRQGNTSIGPKSQTLRITAASAADTKRIVWGRWPKVKRSAVEISAFTEKSNRESKGNIQHNVPIGSINTVNQAANIMTPITPSKAICARTVQTNQIRKTQKVPHKSVALVAVLNSLRKVVKKRNTAPASPLLTHFTVASYSAVVEAPAVSSGKEQKSQSKLSVSISKNFAVPRQRDDSEWKKFVILLEHHIGNTICQCSCQGGVASLTQMHEVNRIHFTVHFASIQKMYTHL